MGMKLTWSEKSIDELAYVGRGKSRHRPRNEPSLYGGDHPFIQTAEIHNSDLWITEYGKTYSDKGLAQSKIWEPGTICITNAGENTGDCAILGIKACFPDSVIAVIADHNKADTVFLKYVIDQMKPRLRRVTRGATQDNLSVAKLTSFKFPAPPLNVQKKIGAILGAYGDLISNNRRRIQLLEQAARLLYKEWFVHLRFPGNEHTPIIDGVPEGWEKKPLGELLTLQRGFDLPVSKRKEGLFPIYASTGINGYHAEAKVKGPGVITGRSGSLGTVIYVSSDFWPLNTTLWVKEFKLVGPHYANHLLANMQLEQYNGGAAVPTLNRNDVHRVEVLSPPSLLLRMFDDQSHGIVKQIDVLTSMNLKLTKTRDLLLPKLMNGEVAV